MLDLDRQILGTWDKDLAFELEWLAERYEQVGEAETAKPMRQEAADIRAILA